MKHGSSKKYIKLAYQLICMIEVEWLIQVVYEWEIQTTEKRVVFLIMVVNRLARKVAEQRFSRRSKKPSK